MAEEPFFIAQSADFKEPHAQEAWMIARATEAREEGATWYRFSAHPTIPYVRLVEAWKERPKDEGAPRWQMTSKERANA